MIEGSFNPIDQLLHLGDASEEIACHFKEFIEWLIYSDDIETYGSWEEKWFQIDGDEDAEHYTLDGIYNHWLTNIYNK